jgi:hypothetical protein
MAEELLDGANVVAGFEEVRREAVTKGVARRWFGQPSSLDCLAKAPLQNGFVQVMSTELTTLRIAIVTRRWEDPLPWPFLCGARILA